jgi:hypothetical protein
MKKVTHLFAGYTTCILGIHVFYEETQNYITNMYEHRCFCVSVPLHDFLRQDGSHTTSAFSFTQDGDII